MYDKNLPPGPFPPLPSENMESRIMIIMKDKKMCVGKEESFMTKDDMKRIYRKVERERIKGVESIVSELSYLEIALPIF